MKMYLSVLLALCLAVLTLVPAFASEETDVVIDGTWKILIAPDDTPQANYSAKKIQSVLAEALGTTLPIVSSATGKNIAVGAAAECDISDVADNGYRITVKNGSVQINGTGSRGVVAGAYRFLEEFAGRKVYTSTLAVLPKADAVTMPADTDIVYEPYFEYTDTDWLSPHDVEYSLANGLSGGNYRTIPDEQGGTVNYISNFCHTLTTQFCAADKYFDEHPEYYAFHDYKRVPEQLCLTNEETLKIVLDEVLTLLKEKHNPTAAVQIISLTQHDNQRYCECENCKALDEANGSHAGTMITFVNKVAAAVKEAGYDNVAIDTFAYQYTRKAPTNVKPLDNVIVRMCTIEGCFSHPLDDPDCPRNAAIMKDLSDWDAICDRLYIWDYVNNYANTIGPFPDFGVLQKNIQIFCEHGVKGVYEEGNYYMSSCDTEMGELRAYMLSKLMQDPYLDYNAVMNEFLDGYYGTGWKNIREYIDMTTESAAKAHLSCFASMEDSLHFSDEEIAKCDELWEKAKAECTDETQLENIKRSELSWRFWKASVNKSEFASIFGGANDRKALVADILATGATRASEGGSSLQPAALYQYSSADTWFNSDNGGLLVNVILVLAWALFGIALIFALIVFIKAIKNKRPVCCFVFPLLAATAELALWHRRAYLAWRDIDQYIISLIIACLVYAFITFVLSRANGEKGKKNILAAFLGIIIFVVPYFAATVIINIVIFKEAGNQLAIAVAYLLSAVSMLVIELLTAKSFTRSKK